jgi:hypothetical protein
MLIPRHYFEINYGHFLRFQVPTEASINMAAFWYIAPWRLVEVD